MDQPKKDQFGSTPHLAGQTHGTGEAVLPPLPIGVTSFREICDGGFCYVDKTLLIKMLLDKKPKVVLYTRPRRFGKSLNLDMLHTFFGISDTDTSGYFADKKIWQCGPEYTSEQGRYPVISLSFLSLRSKTLESLRAKMRRMLLREYKRHCSEIDLSALPDWMHEDANLFAHGDPSDDDLHDSLRSLTEVLHAYYGVPAVILLDEYDTPVESAWDEGFYGDAMELVRSVLTPALKGNPDLAFACLTGVLRVAKEGLFSGLNHLKVDGVLEESYDEFFGFTPDEVRALAAARGAGDKYQEIAEWYEGYRFGGQEVFNPWSVLNYLDNNFVPEAYWANMTDNKAVMHILERSGEDVLQGVADLLNGVCVWSSVQNGLVYPDIDSVDGTGSARAAYTLLLMAGYLTTTSNMRIQSNEEDLISKRDLLPERELRIPNLELMRVYRGEILVRLTAPFNEDLRSCVWRALRAGNAADVQAALMQALNTASSFDLTSERDYHLWLLGLLDFLHGYQLLSNRESGKGRYDLSFEPLLARLPGMIIEIKHKKRQSGKALDKLADSALRQIRQKDYVANLRGKGVRHVLAFGMACSGKNVRVVSEMMQT